MITGAIIIEKLGNGAEKIITLIIILLVTIITQKSIKKILAKSFKKSSKLIKVDETNYKFFQHITSAFIYIIGIGLAIYSIPALRALSVSLFAGAGILAVVIGFASQQAFSNIVSGVFITIFKPFRVGDRISIGADLRGTVEDIGLRHTTIKTFENKRILIPNTVISNEKIENASLSGERICRFIEFSIGYDSNIDKAMNIMKTLAEKHPLCVDNRTEEDKENKKPIVDVKLTTFTDSGMTLRAAAWAENSAKAFEMGCDLNKRIKEKFDKEGIEIPFPYRTIVYKHQMEKNKKINKSKKIKK